ncbi:MAG: sugar ABC transporter permease [Chloroflexales bacterium]|nr:sugar ABC transporter permease [Chloroflexales bacterium]
MIAPAVILLLLFLIGPFVLGIVFSFTNQRLISANPTEFVGLRNYSRLLRVAVLPLEPEIDETSGQPARDEAGNLQYPRTRQFTRDEEQYPQYAGMREWFSVDIGTTRYYLLAGDPTFLRSLVNILYFAVVVVPLQSSVGLALALLINRKLRGVNIFRTIFFSPVVTSMVVISIVWTFIYEKNVGLMNQIVGALTFGQVGPIDWLGDERFAMPSIILMSAWQGVGFQMVLFLAGLQSIPESHYEAASIDGANGWQQFRYITIPGLRNVIVFILITITIAAFQLFTQVFVMTNGGPNDATTTVAFHMVREGFREQDIAYASTIAVVFFLLILAVSMIQRYLTREKEA